MNAVNLYPIFQILSCNKRNVIRTKNNKDKYFDVIHFTGWERTRQMLCIEDTSLSVSMTLRMCLRELCCLFTVWI